MALQSRPPVVTIMGHVDHGKTSLLDYIRKTRVAAGEAGGITQHIGAYQAEYQGKAITFIDTPGHAAFSKMRSRGAAVTDIVVLVVAADDGVKPQTVESIQHIKKAGVPFVVAMNKMDVENASPEMVKAQLTEQEIYTVGYGGDVEAIPLSARSGQGVDHLLETLVTMGEVLELQADPEAPFQGVVIESSKDPFRGSVATVLVQSGTLRPRDLLYADGVTGKVRSLTDAAGRNVAAAGPALPIEIMGFDDLPAVGATVTSVPGQKLQAASPAAARPFVFPSEAPTATLRIILKADFSGTLQAIRENLAADNLEIIAEGVGDVSESDVQLAETTGARIITFQVKAPNAIKKLAERSGVKIKSYRIIYELLEDIQTQLLRLMDPAIAEEELGRAQVLKVFDIRSVRIYGCRVVSGVMRKGDKVHLKQGEAVLVDAVIAGIKTGKQDLDMVETGQECGITLIVKKGYELREGDEIVAFRSLDE